MPGPSQRDHHPIPLAPAAYAWNSTDAAEFAKMLLSENGSITANAATEAFTITDGVPNGGDNYASSSTLVVYDFEENVEEIQALIDELDTKPAQILIEATILQTTLNEANAFGVDFALIQNLDFTDFVALSTNYGKTVDQAFADGDVDGDKQVTFTDFIIVSRLFGT